VVDTMGGDHFFSVLDGIAKAGTELGGTRLACLECFGNRILEQQEGVIELGAESRKRAFAIFGFVAFGVVEPQLFGWVAVWKLVGDHNRANRQNGAFN